MTFTRLAWATTGAPRPACVPAGAWSYPARSLRANTATPPAPPAGVVALHGLEQPLPALPFPHFPPEESRGSASHSTLCGLNTRGALMAIPSWLAPDIAGKLSFSGGCVCARMVAGRGRLRLCAASLDETASILASAEGGLHGD